MIRKSLIDDITAILLLSPLFFSSLILTKTPFEFYISYVPMLLYLPFFTVRYGINKAVVIILSLLLFFGMMDVIDGDNTFASLIKIWINIAMSSIYFYQLFKYYDLDIQRLMRLYMKGAFFVSIIGLVQVASYVVGFRPGYDYSSFFNKWGLSFGGVIGFRLNSIYAEPSYFGSAIAPAFFISAYNLIFNKNIFFDRKRGLVIMVAYLFTFSTMAFIGIFVTLMLFLLNYGVIRYSLFAVPVIIAAYFYTYNNVDDFRFRIDGLRDLASGSAVSAFEVHGSSFVLYNNFTVMLNNLKENPLTGSGLGSHQFAFDEYSLVREFGGIYEFNKLDANSMLIRILSETGLFGLVLTAMFIYRFFVRKEPNNENESFWVISNAALLIIILQLARQGNYTFNGFFFFVWLYYFTYIRHKDDLAEKAESEETTEPEEEDRVIPVLPPGIDNLPGAGRSSPR